MSTYGSIPGVRISTSTGTITGVTIGREQHLILVGVGNDEAEAETNEPLRLDDRRDADTKFGEDSDVAIAFRRALANGQHPDYIHAVRAETMTDTETGTSGTLANAPAVPDMSRLEAEDTTSSDTYAVELTYESPPEAPTEAEVVHLNPNTGEFDADDTEVDITYDYADWEEALWAAEDIMSEAEFGLLSPLTAADSVKTDMQVVVEQMRTDLKFVLAHAPAEPNMTGSDNEAMLDTGTFEQSFSDSTLFISGPSGVDTDSAMTESALNGIELHPAVSGLMAGNDTTEPIYDASLTAVESPAQTLSRSAVMDLRDEYVIPIRDNGVTRIEDNHSTYDQDTDGGWERDYFRRRIVDLTMATIYQIARRQIGSILDDDTIRDVAEVVDRQLDDLSDDRLLEAGGQDFSVYRKDDRTIGIDLTITPYGVAKSAEVDLTINA